MGFSLAPSSGRVNRVEKLIINLDTAMPLSCAWDDCAKRARTPYQVKVCEHNGRCGSEAARHGRHSSYAFCSDRCRTYWLANSGSRAHRTAAENRGRIYGQLPAGMKGIL
jgi:endogenous inhibitor of DNA gyrase (YacG/DUF329 family)